MSSIKSSHLFLQLPFFIPAPFAQQTVSAEQVLIHNANCQVNNARVLFHSADRSDNAQVLFLSADRSDNAQVLVDNANS